MNNLIYYLWSETCIITKWIQTKQYSMTKIINFDYQTVNLWDIFEFTIYQYKCVSGLQDPHLEMLSGCKFVNINMVY